MAQSTCARLTECSLCVAGKLRSADCVARGKVTAVVLSKHDFADLDNPLLSWMLDYDAVANVLKVALHNTVLHAGTAI